MDYLNPGQHIDFVTIRIRNEGGGRVSFAKSHHAFIETIQLGPGEAFLLCCTCPMVDKFVVLQRVGEAVMADIQKTLKHLFFYTSGVVVSNVARRWAPRS